MWNKQKNFFFIFEVEQCKDSQMKNGLCVNCSLTGFGFERLTAVKIRLKLERSKEWEEFW